MIKLLREFLTTGIEAHKKSIEACEKSLETSIAVKKSHEQNFIHGINAIKGYERDVYNCRLNIDARIARLSAKKRKTLEDKAQLEVDLKMKQYYEEHF